MLDSYQFGWGYVIAPNDLQLHVALDDPALARYDYLAQGSQAQYTAPADFVECDGALPVAPDSLYEDQLARRRSQ